MPRVPPRSFSREFKLEAAARMEAGERVSALSRELGVCRKLLYEWRDRLRAGGAEALRPKGRPRTSETLAAPASEAEASRRKIAELERKVGQQALMIDFFRGALQRIEASRQASDGPGGTASSPRSRR